MVRSDLSTAYDVARTPKLDMMPPRVYAQPRSTGLEERISGFTHIFCHGIHL